MKFSCFHLKYLATLCGGFPLAAQSPLQVDTGVVVPMRDGVELGPISTGLLATDAFRPWSIARRTAGPTPPEDRRWSGPRSVAATPSCCRMCAVATAPAVY